MQRKPYLTYLLLSTNIFIFLSGIVSQFGKSLELLEKGNINFRNFILNFGANYTLVDKYALYFPYCAQGQWYRIITSGFIHLGIIHLLCNMSCLYHIGGFLERKIGSIKFGIIYFISLVSGSIMCLIFDKEIASIGASGAIYGIFVALYIIAKCRGERALSRTLGIDIIINFIITFTIPHISIFGHLGGAIAGLILGLLIA